ncbi:sulfite exporter TauE/SafE family protein [Arcicella sp. LKC2W]|uniref:sulfite exporter TauE/SafE family protein n=1 Tax=Arcicella sp. LKC2W TaxID=2984198 RepID=UPI002B1FA7A2|nr:sulfite exporter TauE/SafE family protein [Arcicella sp. LKC2W]MEA5460881.1 sulfite exporter TauE/SafE family protein [Arcicella sp. LKC2W]
MKNVISAKSPKPWLYIFFLISVISTWLWYMISHDNFGIFATRWPAALTMLFGSFIAGASPEGSAAIAYPIFTLLLKIPPDVTRNFAFAIQSIGMTSASLLILGLKIKVDWNYILYVSIGGIFGLVFGTYYIAPLISPMHAKLFFVSLWLSFGIALWLQNKNSHREVFDSIQNLLKSDILKLVLFGFVGGIISSIFGTGINIFTFCLMTIYYQVSEKVATPSSVIIMTIETLLGVFIHTKINHDFQPLAFELWLTCIPVVVFFAPFGAFVISKMRRESIAQILYSILIIQFLGAMWVIKPSILQFLICVVILFVGIGLFSYLAVISKRRMRQSRKQKMIYIQSVTA